MLFKKYISNAYILSFFLFFLSSFLHTGAPLDFDFANDPEFAKMMEEFERELANLSPEERQQFDEMVNEFQRVLEEMPEEDFNKLIEDINNDIAANGGLRPESPVPVSEIMPVAPVFVEIPEEIKTLAEVIQAIKTNISMLLTKIQIAPEIALKINKWVSQGKVTGAPEHYTWDQLHADLEKFVSLLANLLATNKKMKPIFLFSIHENKALEQSLIQFSAEILEVSAIEIVEFGAKQTKYTNQLLINILSLFCELNFGKNVMTNLNAIYQKHIAEVAGQKKDEKIPQMPKESFGGQPTGFSGGNFDQPSYGGGDFFGNEPSYGGGYSDYGNYPSYGGYDSFGDYDYKEKGEKEGGKGTSGFGGGASGGKSAGSAKGEKKEEELKDKSGEIFKEIENNKKDLQLALSKAVGTINSTELQECLIPGEEQESVEELTKTKKITEKKEEVEKKEITEEKPQEIPEAEKVPTSTEKVPLTEEQKKLIEELDKVLGMTAYDIAELTEESYEKFANYIQELLKKLEPIATLPEVQDKIMELKDKLAKKFQEEKQEINPEEKTGKKMTTPSIVFIKIDTKEKFEKQLETVQSRAESLNKSVNKIKVKKKKNEVQEKIAKELEDDVVMIDALFEGLKDQPKNATNTILIDDLKDTLKTLDPFMTKKMKEDKKKKEDGEKKK